MSDSGRDDADLEPADSPRAAPDDELLELAVVLEREAQPDLFVHVEAAFPIERWVVSGVMWLSRRHRDGTIPWPRFNRLLERYPLPRAVVVHSVYCHAANP